MMDGIDKFKEHILNEHPRLKPDHEFQFECRPGLSCFNQCCADVNIFLTPYDIIRLKNRLGMTSGEFLERYALTPFGKDSKFPVIMLRMADDEKKKCQLVSEDGCTVYSDRPWACRMFPLGVASPGESNREVEEEFYFILKESICRGFDSDKKLTLADYMESQGVDEYERHSTGYKYLTTHRFFTEGNILPPEKVDMFYTACYDIDEFRRFVFESSFLAKFEVDPERVTRMREDDLALLELAFEWLRFALFGEKTMVVRADILAQKKDELEAQQQAPEK